MREQAGPVSAGRPGRHQGGARATDRVAVKIRTLEITTNVGCRIRCSYCPQSELLREYNAKVGSNTSEYVMSFANFTKFLSTVPANVDIHFSGFAEPWHSSSCTEMVRYAHATGHKVAVFTTTDGMDKDDIEAIVDIPFKRFLVHLPDQFEEMRAASGEKLLRNLAHIKHAGIHNLEFLTLGIPHHRIRSVVGPQPSTRRIHSRAGNLRTFGPTIGVALDEEQIIARTHGKSLNCRRDRMLSNVLLPNGDVYFCAMDYGLRHRIGNLNIESFIEVIEGKAYRDLLSRMKDETSDILCRRCEYAIQDPSTA